MWLSTVRRDSARFAAISRAVLPSTTCRATSSCRVVIAKVVPGSALVESLLSVLPEDVVHIDDVRVPMRFFGVALFASAVAARGGD